MTPEQYAHYNDPVVLAFCKEKGVMPPPYWSPDGKSGVWQWDEEATRKINTKFKETHFGSGSWVWVADGSGETVSGLYVKSNKEEKGIVNWLKRIFRGSFSCEKKNLKK